jgi:hypothetical protein
MRTVTVSCSVTLTLKVDEGQEIQEVLADLVPEFSRGDLTSYDIEDAIVHLDQADVTDSR